MRMCSHSQLHDIAQVFTNLEYLGGSSFTFDVGTCIQLLTSGSPPGRNDACKALYNPSIRTANKSRIIKAGAVPALICFLDEPPSRMAETFVCVLANLATVSEGRASIAQERRGISGLVEAIESGGPRAQENAAATLWQLAKHSRKHRAAIPQEVVIPPLVAISQTGTPRAKIKVRGLGLH